MKFGLPAGVVRKITAVFARYPQVEKATLYGSRAKGNYKTGADFWANCPKNVTLMSYTWPKTP